MSQTNPILQAAALTLRSPRDGATLVLRLPIPDAAIWPLVALSVVLSTLVAEFNGFVNPPNPGQTVVYIPPVGLALMLGAVNVSMAVALVVTGRWFGGQGTVRASLLLTAWQQFIWFGVLFALTILAIIMPGVSGALSLGFGIYMIWILICFAAVLHGLETFFAGLALLLASVAAAFVMIMALGVLGVSLGEGIVQ